MICPHCHQSISDRRVSAVSAFQRDDTAAQNGERLAVIVATTLLMDRAESITAGFVVDLRDIPPSMLVSGMWRGFSEGLKTRGELPQARKLVSFYCTYEFQTTAARRALEGVVEEGGGGGEGQRFLDPCGHTDDGQDYG